MTVEELDVLPGVQFNDPPDETIPSIMAAIDKSLSHLPDDVDGALVGIATQHGANAAVVARIGKGWDVTAWIGKSWRNPQIDRGVAVRKVWKR